MTYRPDIDGLRAIAVTLVILFHAKTGIFDGGYVGVDVFFAISGFLITSIIYKKMMNDNFSFIDFYKRRALRLLPASMFITLISVLVFSFIYPPDLFKILSESALASLLFSSNIYFWQTSSYFSPSLELQPLLHTWSLSVEEQFYFLFPISLLILLKFKLKPIYTMLLVLSACLFSLFLSYKYAPNSLSFVGFYVLPTRFYEMGLGALLAIYLFHQPSAFNRIKYLREIGLCLIAISALFYDRYLAFPSYYALMPVIGTLMMLADTRQKGLVFSLLCAKPIVFIGLLSYSLYLWHWPIWVAMEWIFDGLSDNLTALYFAITFVLSYVSYKLIEKPLRNPAFYRARINKLILPSLATSLFLCLFFFLNYTNKPVLPISQSALTSYQQALQKEPFREICTDTKRLGGDYAICEVKRSDNPRYRILLWGDSHASAFMSAFAEFSDQFSVYAMNTSGCPSLINTKRRGGGDCYLHNNFMQEYLANIEQSYDLIVNVSAWDNYIEFSLLETELTQTEQMQKSLQQTIAFYDKNAIKYAFIPQIPKHEPHIPLAFFKTQLGIKSRPSFIERQLYQTKVQRFEDMLFPSKNMISLEEVFCEEKCLGEKNNAILYQDQHHLSVAGGKLIAPHIEQKVTNIINSQSPSAMLLRTFQSEVEHYE